MQNADITIRPFTNADIGFIINNQIELYVKEYGLTSDIWRSYVHDGVHELADNFDPDMECMYILEVAEKPAGCIAIAHDKSGDAKLRFYFIEEFARGLGAGRKLIDMAVDFCVKKGYKRIFLWTFSTLYAARHLYAKKGFRITDTQENTDWGERVLEERWDLELE